MDIFNTGYRPVPSAIPVWPDGRQATWPATRSTRMSGERDGVDALVTTGESQELADWLAKKTGKNLTEVYFTYAHGDPTSFADFARRTAAAWTVDEAR
jgi:hypothetical protein